MVLKKKHKRLFNEKSPFYPQATPNSCFLQHNQPQVQSLYVLSELINHSQASINLYPFSFHKKWQHMKSIILHMNILFFFFFLFKHYTLFINHSFFSLQKEFQYSISFDIFTISLLEKVQSLHLVFFFFLFFFFFFLICSEFCHTLK